MSKEIISSTSIRQALILLFLLSSCVYSVLFSLNYRYPILFADEWVSLDFYTNSGLLGSIMCTHNGHPTLIPNAIFRATLLLFDSTPLARVSVVIAVAITNALLMGRLVVNATTYSQSKYGKYIIYLVFLCANLWLVNSLKLMWGMAVHDHLVIFGACLAMLGITKLEKRAKGYEVKGILYILLGGVIASLSFGFGGALWGAILIGFVIQRTGNIYYYLIPVIGAILFLAIISFIPSCDAGVSKGITGIGIDPISIALFIPAFLGSPVMHGFGVEKSLWAEQAAVIIGMLGLIWFVKTTIKCFVSKSSNQTQTAFIILGWFSIGSALLVAVGRHDYSNVALAPRFLSVSMAFWISVFSLSMLSGVYWRNGQAGSVSGRRSSFLIMLLFAFYLATTSVSVIKAIYAYNYQLQSALMFIVAANDVQEIYSAKRLQSIKPNTVLNNKSFVRSGHVDIYSQEWAHDTGKRFESIASVRERDDCMGYTSTPIKLGPFFGVSGWARFPDGSPVETIYAVNDGFVVGLGRRAPLLSRALFRQQKNRTSYFEQMLSYLLPYKTAITMGLHSHWTAILNLPATKISDNTKYFAMKDGGEFCEVVMSK